MRAALSDARAGTVFTVNFSAAGFHSDTLVFRDARKPNWQRGLKETAAVVCDLLTAAELPKKSLVVPFPLVSEGSLAELRRYEQFICSPLLLPM